MIFSHKLIDFQMSILVFLISLGSSMPRMYYSWVEQRQCDFDIKSQSLFEIPVIICILATAVFTFGTLVTLMKAR